MTGTSLKSQEASLVPPKTKPSKRLRSLFLEVLCYIVILLIATNLLAEVLQRLSEDPQIESSRRIETDEVTKPILDHIDSNKHHYEAPNPTIKVDFKTPEGVPTIERLNSKEYLDSLTIFSFTQVEMPKSNGLQYKEGPSREDIRYINSKIPPQKVVPAWQDKEDELYTISIYLSEYPKLNISRKRLRRIGYIENIPISGSKTVEMRIQTSKLKKLAGKSTGYFHVYLTKNQLEPNDDPESSGNTLHSISRVDLSNLLMSSEYEDSLILFNPFIAISVVFPSGIIEYPKLSEKAQAHLQLDPLNRRDESGAISLYYPMVFVNLKATKRSRFMELSEDDKYQTIGLEAKLSNRYTIFEYYLYLHDLFQTVENLVGSSLGNLFIDGLIDIQNLAYSFI